MKYKFSEHQVIERYGVQMYSILNELGEVVAYSQKIFEISEKVVFVTSVEPPLIFENAEIRGGVIRGGVIRGGEIWGGVIWGGEIRGGEIWGGVIWGGVIRGGAYTESMLQIQGSAHFCYAYFLEDGGIGIVIGCIRMSINDWIEKYKEIGAQNKYTADQIDEYGAYIDLFSKRYLK